VATFSGLMITVRRERAGEEPAYRGRLSRSHLRASLHQSLVTHRAVFTGSKFITPLALSAAAILPERVSLVLSFSRAGMHQSTMRFAPYGNTPRTFPFFIPRGRDPFDRSVFLVTAGQSSFRRLTSMDRTRRFTAGSLPRGF